MESSADRTSNRLGVRPLGFLGPPPQNDRVAYVSFISFCSSNLRKHEMPNAGVESSILRMSSHKPRLPVMLFPRKISKPKGH